ncbi:hypothetical protein OG196_32105 [Kitasatospora purpeofusca]|uniref:hypothetical protein n=1 Tax=Kitasatospora purpeofusca TaxID=67352 RepID=UPI002E10F353|nr:hypothetical protein OG196_32105 [Kitasatospora purpeofusca]
MPTPAPEPITPENLRTARDKHRRSADDDTLGPAARRYHEHASCGYDWAQRALIAEDSVAALRHLGYANAYAEQARAHATSSRRWTLILPGPFCEWLTTTPLLKDGYTGNEADDRLRLAYHAGSTHQIGASGWTRTIPAHDPLAMLRLTDIAQQFLDRRVPGTDCTPAEARAAKALADRLADLGRRQLEAAS